MVLMGELRAGRRPVLVGVFGGAVTLAGVTAAAKIASVLQDPSPDDGSAALRLSAESPMMSSLSVRLDDRLLSRRGASSQQSLKLSTSLHSMVAVTWRGADQPQLQIRSRVGGRWTSWRRLAVMHDVPDVGSAEASGVRGTQLVWVGVADGIQIKTGDNRVTDLTLVLLHPRRVADDTAVAATTTVQSEETARRSARKSGSPGDGRVPRPALLSRSKWGADESWRERPPRLNRTIEQVHVHHTASGNDYTPDDVAAILRGFYRYHTGSLGWSDLAYNFLVDRFGRIWVGRGGGASRPVRGAHTLGFNGTSVGIAVIGNFDTVTPSKKVLRAIASVAAWKLHPYGRDPQGSVRVASEGSDRFRAGRVARLPVIDGHRDTNETACPGGRLYEELPYIRRRTRALMAKAEAPPVVVVATPARVSGSPKVMATLGIAGGTYTPPGSVSTYAWLRNGVVVPGAVTSTYVVGAADLGASLAAQVTTTKAGHEPTVEVLTVPGTVVAATQTSVRARPRVRKAVVRVRVKAVGAEVVPTGTVAVIVGRRRQTVPLVDGLAVARFTNLRAGRTAVTVRYSGDRHLQRSRATATARVKPRRR
jgi:hypothetical protein